MCRTELVPAEARLWTEPVGTAFVFPGRYDKQQGAWAEPGGVCEMEQDVKAISSLWVVLGKSL